MFKKLIYLLGSMLYSLFSPVLIRAFKGFFYILKSGYYSKMFQNCGINFRLMEDSTILGGKYISIGDNVTLGKRTVLTAWNSLEKEPYVSIGNNTVIGDDCHITAIREILIGSNVLMGKKITITDNSHGKGVLLDEIIHPINRQLFSKGSVIIEDYVWIGDKVTILPGVTIGFNSIIGANSVVTKNIESNSIAVGNPAKIITIS